MSRVKNHIGGIKNNKYKIAAIDFGIKHNILRLLESHDCSIKVFPAKVSKNEVLKFNPDGLFLSNGPGDPAAVSYGIALVKFFLEKKITYFWDLSWTPNSLNCIRSKNI